MLNSVIYGLFNMVFMGIANAMSKVPIKSMDNRKFMVIRTIFTTIGFLLIYFLNLKGANFDYLNIILALLLSVIVYLALVFYV
jgi:uncharacterized membrane protein